jgi:hypothetical protein
MDRLGVKSLRKVKFGAVLNTYFAVAGLGICFSLMESMLFDDFW